MLQQRVVACGACFMQTNVEFSFAGWIPVRRRWGDGGVVMGRVGWVLSRCLHGDTEERWLLCWVCGVNGEISLQDSQVIRVMSDMRCV